MAKIKKFRKKAEYIALNASDTCYMISVKISLLPGADKKLIRNYISYSQKIYKSECIDPKTECLIKISDERIYYFLNSRVVSDPDIKDKLNRVFPDHSGLKIKIGISRRDYKDFSKADLSSVVGNMIDESETVLSSVNPVKIEYGQKNNNYMRALEHFVLTNFSAACSSNELKLYLQPKHSSKDYSLKGAEALVRWTSKRVTDFLTLNRTLIEEKYPGYNDSFLPTEDFVKILEKNNRSDELDRYMVEKVKKYQEKRGSTNKPDIVISVNISRTSLLKSGFIHDIESMLPAGFNNKIEFEIAQRKTDNHFDKIKQFANHFRSLGFSVAADDFGSECCDFTELNDIDYTTLKIDGLFFKSIYNSPTELHKKLCIVNLLYNTAKSDGFQMKCVAEGITENYTPYDVQRLNDAGCDEIQGYYFSPPLSESKFDEYEYKKDYLDKKTEAETKKSSGEEDDDKSESRWSLEKITFVIAIVAALGTIGFTLCSLGSLLYYNFDIDYYEFQLGNIAKVSFLAIIISLVSSFVFNYILFWVYEFIHPKKGKIVFGIIGFLLNIIIPLLLFRLIIGNLISVYGILDSINRLLSIIGLDNIGTFMALSILFNIFMYMIILFIKVNVKESIKKLINPIAMIILLFIFPNIPSNYEKARDQKEFEIIELDSEEGNEVYTYVVISRGDNYSAYECSIEDDKMIIYTDHHRYFAVDEYDTTRKVLSAPPTFQ